MNIPVMRTWSTGEVVTAAFLNSNIRDLGLYLLSPPLAVLRQTVAQTFSTNVWGAILFDAEDIDRDNGHSTVTNTSRYSPNTTGWYSLQSTGTFANNASGIRQIAFQNNGAGNKYAKVTIPPVSGFVFSASTVATVFMTAGVDYVEVYGWQSSGGNLNSIIDTESSPRLQVLWISS